MCEIGGNKLKSSLKIGLEKSMTIVVTEEMFAQFGGELVHPTYSTVSMVYHMEWISRDLLLPYLDEDEEGMGAAVTVKHIAPSTLGTKVTITAKIKEITDRKVVTEVVSENENGIIGKGEVVQAVLAKDRLKEKLTK